MCVCVLASQSVSWSVSAPEIQRECGGMVVSHAIVCIQLTHIQKTNVPHTYLTEVIHTDLDCIFFLYDLRVAHIRLDRTRVDKCWSPEESMNIFVVV